MLLKLPPSLTVVRLIGGGKVRVFSPGSTIGQGSYCISNVEGHDARPPRSTQSTTDTFEPHPTSKRKRDHDPFV